MKLHNFIGKFMAKVFKRKLFKIAVRSGCDIDGDMLYIGKGKKKIRTYAYYVNIFSGIAEYCPPNTSVVKGKKFTTIMPRSKNNT